MADTLEEELGIKILERDSFGIRPAPCGELLLPKLKALCEAEADIKKVAKEIKSKKRTVTVGCYPSVCKNLMPALLVKLRKKLPAIEISLIVKDSIREMSAQGADIFLASTTECKDREFVPFYTDRFVAVVNKDRFEGNSVLTLKDFNRFPFIMPNDKKIKKEFSVLTTDIINVSADDDSSIVEMVKNGIENTVLSELSVTNAAGVKILNIEPEIKRELVITAGKNSPEVRKVIKVITE